MRLLKKEPESGQFVAIWEFNGTVWSGVFRRDNEGVTWYNPESDEFEAGQYGPVYSYIGAEVRFVVQ